MRNIALTLALLAPTATPAAAGFLDGVAVFGGAGATVNDNVTGGLVASNGTVTLGAFQTVGGIAGGALTSPLGGGTVNGPVTVNGDVTGGPFGFPGAINGPVNSGGNVDLASRNINGPVTTAGNVNLQFATVTGDILAGGSVSLAAFSNVNGSVTANGGITGGPITGTATPFAGVPVDPVPYAPITLTADAFTSGGADVTAGTFSPPVNLAPGSYGAVQITGGIFSALSLTAGDYFFDSLTLDTTLNLDLSGGPINVFVTGDINLTGGSVNVNGQAAFLPGRVPNPEVQDLASQVLFESLGNITNGAPFGTGFFGTLYAPNGNISTSFGPVVGSLVAGGTVNTASFSPVFYVGNDRLLATGAVAMPEPASAALLAAGGLAAWGARRRRTVAA